VELFRAGKTDPEQEAISMKTEKTHAASTPIRKTTSPAGRSHTFGLDALNGITRFDSIADAIAAGYNNPFSSMEELGEIVGDGNTRILAIWNAQAGVQPVARFMNRVAGLTRIWNHLQTICATVPPAKIEIEADQLLLPERSTPELPPDTSGRRVNVGTTKPIPESARAKVFGFPVTQAIAWMGREGFNFNEAVAVLTSLEVCAGTDSTVRTYLTKGKAGSKKAAAFDVSQAARLFAARPAPVPTVVGADSRKAQKSAEVNGLA
jgi:hypothetical protein